MCRPDDTGQHCPTSEFVAWSLCLPVSPEAKSAGGNWQESIQ